MERTLVEGELVDGVECFGISWSSSDIVTTACGCEETARSQPQGMEAKSKKIVKKTALLFIIISIPPPFTATQITIGNVIILKRPVF